MEKSSYEVATLIGLTALAGVVLAAAMPWGLGLSPDSVVYIGAARSLAQGHGFSLPKDSITMAPVVHYPPLYPALLAVASFGGLDVIAAAKWLNVLVFCANVFLAGMVGTRVTGDFRLAMISAGLVASAFPMALAHSMVWSEPLFVVGQSAALLFLLSYLREGARRSLIAAAMATGLSILGRYAGVSLVISGTTAILWLGADRWKKKFLDSGIFLAVSLLPIGLWAVRNRWAHPHLTRQTCLQLANEIVEVCALPNLRETYLSQYLVATVFIKYAEKKDVLIIHAAGNDSKDIGSLGRCDPQRNSFQIQRHHQSFRT